MYHVVGKGRTTGFASIFFKVNDRYESYFGTRRRENPISSLEKSTKADTPKDVEINFDHNKEHCHSERQEEQE